MNKDNSHIKVSIVAPCYNEAESIREFCRRSLTAAKEAVDDDFELILVDDGSRDDTWSIISELSKDVSQIVGMRLLRNHGHQLAATAGLAASQGERVMLIDADLQDPPELLSQMMALMDQGADVVYGKRISRTGETRFKLVTASLFYRLLSSLTAVYIPRDTGDFRLMTRRITNIFLNMPERSRFIRGMISWIGGTQIPLEYHRDTRFAGTTKYPLRKMINFAVDAITSFSVIPLRISTWLGICSACFALLLGLYSVIEWMMGGTVTGWSSIMVAVTLLGAIQLLALGMIGEYLGRLVQDNKRRPLFMIDQILRQGSAYHVRDDFSELGITDKQTDLSKLYEVTGSRII